MANYQVKFIQTWDYYIEADTEDDAEKIAYEEFKADMYYPVAHTTYDYIEIEEIK